MNDNMLKMFVFVFLMFSVVLMGVPRSFAQEDASDEQAREEQTRQTLNQIKDLELRMQENAKRLDALEKAVNQPETAVTEPDNTAQEVPAEVVPEKQAVPVEEVPVVQEVAPVETAPVKISPTEKAMAEIKAEPADVLPIAPIYYEPLTAYPKEHSFELSQEDFYSAYRQSGEHRDGAFFGINAAYSYRPWEAQYWPINVFHVDVHGDYGQVNYNFGDDGKTKNINNYTVEPRVWVGKDFVFGSSTRLTPYVGAGYRWHYEELKNKITDSAQIAGLNFLIQSNNTQTQYVYIPIGAQLSFNPIGGWKIDMNSEYDFLVWGRVTNYAPGFSVNSINIYSPAVSNTLRNGFGIRGSVKFTKEEDTFNYFIEPFVRYWNIRASDTVSDPFTLDGTYIGSVPVQQERSRTTEVGARAGIEF